MNILEIIYTKYYELDGSNTTLGGIQTYIDHLSDLSIRLGYNVRIIQQGKIKFEKKIKDGITLYGLPIKNFKSLGDELYAYAVSLRNTPNAYLTVFATDFLIPGKKIVNSISLQHGITWDIEEKTSKSRLMSFISKAKESYKTIKRFSFVEDVVCVDYNFICWHRTQLHERNINLIPIPNFAKIGPETIAINDGTKIKIVFARRFFEYRGTRIFVDAMLNLLNKYDNIEVTLAGTGPDEQYLREKFEGYNHVRFTQYNSGESIKFHSQFDIAVVPTTGSEGTSLSLLEAMSAHCAIVCTNVGGITNIIVDGFNGLMVSPNSKELAEAIEKFVLNKDLRLKLAQRGYETVRDGFSLDQWEAKWSKVLAGKFENYK